MIWILYYGFSILFFIFAFLDISWRLWKRKLSFLPHTPNLPWIGGIPYWSGDPHITYMDRMKYAYKLNHLFVVWVTWTPAIRIGRVEYIEALLKSQDVISKSIFYTVLAEWLGEGLLISSKGEWKKRRTALTSAFHFTILNDFMEIYEKHAQNLVAKLHNVGRDGKVIEVQELVSLSMLDVICETSMGVNINALNSSESEYVKAVGNIKRLLLKRFTNPLYNFKMLYYRTANGKEYSKCLNILHNFTKDVINKNIESRRNSPNVDMNEDEDEKEDNRSFYRRRKKVFIDVLLDLYDKGEIDFDGIREEVDTFMFRGHDTTSSGLSWILYEIGRHPEIQEKVYQEIVDVSSRDCSLMDKIRSLRYTECVVKESLRLHPPVPAYDRKLERDMIIDGNTIPSGTILLIDTFSVHMNPAYWDEPAMFNPGRFEGNEKRNPYCYIPFSAGPRNCIGQKFAMLEEKVFVYYIISNFFIHSTQRPDEIKVGCDLIKYSVNGINLTFLPRN